MSVLSLFPFKKSWKKYLKHQGLTRHSQPQRFKPKNDGLEDVLSFQKLLYWDIYAKLQSGYNKDSINHQNPLIRPYSFPESVKKCSFSWEFQEDSREKGSLI